MKPASFRALSKSACFGYCFLRCVSIHFVTSAGVTLIFWSAASPSSHCEAISSPRTWSRSECTGLALLLQLRVVGAGLPFVFAALRACAFTQAV